VRTLAVETASLLRARVLPALTATRDALKSAAVAALAKPAARQRMGASWTLRPAAPPKASDLEASVTSLEAALGDLSSRLEGVRVAVAQTAGLTSDGQWDQILEAQPKLVGFKELLQRLLDKSGNKANTSVNPLLWCRSFKNTRPQHAQLF